MGCYTKKTTNIPTFPKHIELISVKDNNIIYHNYYDKKIVLELINVANGDFIVKGSGIFIVPNIIKFVQNNNFVLDFSSKIIKKIVVKNQISLLNQEFLILKKYRLRTIGLSLYFIINNLIF